MRFTAMRERVSRSREPCPSAQCRSSVATAGSPQRLRERDQRRRVLGDAERGAVALQRGLRHARQLARRNDAATDRLAIATRAASCRDTGSGVSAASTFARARRRADGISGNGQSPSTPALHVLGDRRALHERAAHRFRRRRLEFLQAEERQREADRRERREVARRASARAAPRSRARRATARARRCAAGRDARARVGDGSSRRPPRRGKRHRRCTCSTVSIVVSASNSASRPRRPRRTSRGAFVERYQKYDGGSSR